MNTKWIVMSAVVLTISFCIAVFVFAQAGVRGAGGVARVDSIVRSVPIAEDIQLNKRPMPVPKTVNTASGIRYFDDTDRFVASGESPIIEDNATQKQTAAGVSDTNATTASENSTDAVAVGMPVSGATGASDNDSIQTQHTVANAPREIINPPTTQEDIPMPQLPSLGGDYDNGDEDESGASGVELPQLPDEI